MNIVNNSVRFLALEPTEYARMTNSSGQVVIFYEHPTRGDDAPVYGCINGVVFNTGFYELDDMTCEHGEYTPHLIGDDGCSKIEILCGFELA